MIKLKESEINYKGYKIQPTNFGWSVWDGSKKVINTSTDKEAQEYIDDLVGDTQTVTESYSGRYTHIERNFLSLTPCGSLDEFIDGILEFGYDLTETPEWDESIGIWVMHIVTDEEDIYGEPVIYNVQLRQKNNTANRGSFLELYDIFEED